MKATNAGPTLVCVNFDGPNFMQGKKDGVAGKLIQLYGYSVVYCTQTAVSSFGFLEECSIIRKT